MQNILRSLSVRTLLDPLDDDVLNRSTRLELDSFGRGAGDPAGIGVLEGERLVIALSGVDQVGLAAAGEGRRPRRFAVGRRPTAVVAACGRAYVVNSFSDSISVFDAGRGEVSVEIPLGPTPELTPRDRGEIAFHDARLSRESWFSCQSCHTDGHTNDLLADTLGDGTHGTPKRVLSLLGAGETGPWAWNGGAETLVDQVEKSFAGTMHATAVPEGTAADLAAYIAGLEPPPPAVGPPVSEAERVLVDRGRALFDDLDCTECHAPPTYSAQGRYDVGLEDEEGLRRFNPPSLRGVGHRQRFFHDGRALSLEDVFRVHRHRVDEDLSQADLEALVRFLRGL
jgi:mono/diheme cytochrome c family protein